MRCPFCDADKEHLKVIDSRSGEAGRAIRRRRRCLSCKKRFTTYERIEENIRLTVIKKDGSRVPFDRQKLLTGLERACYKRPIKLDDLQRVVDDIEEEIHKSHDKEVPSSVIGGLVTEKLRRLDQVAYVRFASVYKRFNTLEDLVQEAKAVLDARRFDDPGQGRLFLEAPATSNSGAPGNGGEEEEEPAVHKPGRPRKSSPST
jgi:transcriptional repressor NrdR